MLKVFLTWCNDENITTLNIKKYKGEETIKETYSDDELKKLLKKPNFKNCTFVEYRTWVIINLLVNGGSRASTIRNIKIQDIPNYQEYQTALHLLYTQARFCPLSHKANYKQLLIDCFNTTCYNTIKNKTQSVQIKTNI